MLTKQHALGLLAIVWLGCDHHELLREPPDAGERYAGEPDASKPGASEPDANEGDDIEPPPPDVIFIRFRLAVEFAMDGTPIRFETRYLFDDLRLRALCLLPDADSFDD